MTRLAVGCALLSACVNIQPYTGPDAAIDVLPPTPGSLGTIADVTAAPDGSGVTVGGPGYLLHFDRGNAHFPDSFMVAGKETLQPGPGCGQAAGLMGDQLWPAADSEMPPTGSTSAIAIASTGPSVARVTITWTVALGACGTAHVDSWWTFFPDGRISRYDHVTGSVTYQASCGCPGSQIQFRNVTLFKAEIAQSITGPNDTSQSPDSMGNAGNVNDRLCIANPDFKLLSVDSPGPGPLLYSVGADVGVVFTMGDPSAQLMGPTGGYFSELRPMLPATSCTDIIAIADGYAGYVSLHTNGGGPDPTDYDGIAEGYTPEGSFGVSDPSDIFTFETMVDSGAVPAPPGYAIGIAFTTRYASFTVERTASGTTTTLDDQAARVQQLDGGNAILWLRDGLPFGQTVKVTPHS